MPDATEALQSSAQPVGPPPARPSWIYPALRVVLVIAAGVLAWYVAGHWNRWTGAARYEATDDAYTVGDVTPLVGEGLRLCRRPSPVADYQIVHKGDLIVEIDASDYRAQLAQAEANLAAAQATLANLANQKDVQRALIRQAEATIQATQADLLRYALEAKRQRDLLQTRIAGTQQTGRAGRRQRKAHRRRNCGSTRRNSISRRPCWPASTCRRSSLQAQVRAAEAQVTLARNNVDYTRIVSPADGMVGQRQVRPGQFVNVGTQVIAVVPLPQHLGDRELTRRRR